MKSALELTKAPVVFSTRDFSLSLGATTSAASHQLRRLSRKKALVQVTRGIWANTAHPHFSPMGCVPYLLGTEQGYVSFLSALHHHGMLSQIPTRITVATTGHTRLLKSTVGVFEFLMMRPTMMTAGIDWVDTATPYRMASPEKALLDTYYIATRKGRRFAKLPELDLKETPFRRKEFLELLKAQVSHDWIRTSILSRFELLMRYKRF